MKDTFITQYILFDKHHVDVDVYHSKKALETYLEKLDQYIVEEFDIIFVYSDGNVTHRRLEDVVDFIPTLNPEYT